MLIKSLFKSSFGQSNVVLRGRFVVCSGDLCVVDNAGRQAIVVERALDNFQNKPTCRLINPAKSEIGRLSHTREYQHYCQTKKLDLTNGKTPTQ